MTHPKIMVTCIICESDFQMGFDHYAGTWIPRYEMHVCSTCYAGNWDGYARHFEPQILENLRSKGLPEPPRNEKGYLPRD